MSVDLKNAFRLLFVTGGTALPIPAVSEILARLRSRPVWDVASIAPADEQFPLCRVEWHEGHGFVIQCYEDEQAWSDFLLTAVPCGPPTIEINLVRSMKSMASSAEPFSFRDSLSLKNVSFNSRRIENGPGGASMNGRALYC